MTEITVNIEIYCAKCGTGICSNATPRTDRYNRNEPTFDIEPCATCLENEKSEGHDEGYKEGYDDGHNIGFTEGADSHD